jgi:DNA-directed RNA polymerase specialized sigma24 family protein
MTTVTPQSDDIDRSPADFERFYRTTVERTYRAAFRMARGDPDVARDATQDAYARVLRQWSGEETRSGQGMAGRDEARYVAAVAVRRVAKVERRNDRTPAGHERGGTEHEDVPGRELPASVRELIDRQPVERRAVAILFFLLECPDTEIADILAIPETVIRGHVERMRVLMKPLVDGVRE